MRDVIGSLIIELREDPGVQTIYAGIEVRGQELAQGDAKPPRDWKPHIRIVTLATPRLKPRVPVSRNRYSVNCYGRSPEEAALLYGAASACVHAKGPREGTAGYWTYVSHDDTGGSYFVDPDTKQPGYSFVVELLATTQAVTA